MNYGNNTQANEMKKKKTEIEFTLKGQHFFNENFANSWIGVKQDLSQFLIIHKYSSFYETHTKKYLLHFFFFLIADDSFTFLIYFLIAAVFFVTI